jgi:hypothetical protein
LLVGDQPSSGTRVGIELRDDFRFQRVWGLRGGLGLGI